MSSRPKRYKTVIIGCGAIAGGYDKPNDKNILTHAHALTVHKRTILSGVYDISLRKAKLFAQKWNTTAYDDLDRMLFIIEPEIIYVCASTEKHLLILEKILNYQPKVVICEKPLGNDIKKAEIIVKKYRRRRVGLIVNYTRRFDSVIQRLRRNIRSGNYGQLINASTIYTKGIMHNGSHVIDLLRYFLGELKDCKVYSATIDYHKADPTLDAFLRFKNKAGVHLIAGDENKYSIFEMDLFFSKARITLDRFGLEYTIQNVRQDPLFFSYKDLGDKKRAKTELNRALLNLLDNAIGYIEKRKAVLCSAEDALKTQRVCINLLREYQIDKKESG